MLADEQEYRLTKYLMANYDASVRPAENSSIPLKVIFGISLHHIIDVVSSTMMVSVVKSKRMKLTKVALLARAFVNITQSTVLKICLIY